MAAFSSVLIGLGATALVGKTVHDVHKANMAERDARNFRNDQQYKQDQLIKQADERVKQEEQAEKNAAAAAAREQSQAIQKSTMKRPGGRRSTILTSPLGVVGEAQTTAGRKTLLGT